MVDKLDGNEPSTFPLRVYLLFHLIVLLGMIVLAGFNIHEGNPLLLAANIAIIASLLISLVMIARGKLRASINFLLTFAVVPPTILLIISTHQGERVGPFGPFVVPHLMTMIILAGLFLDNLRLVWLVIGYAAAGAVAHEVLSSRGGAFSAADSANVAIFLALAAAGAITLVTTRNRLLTERDRADDSTRAKSEFLARMSHEIRTPLSGARGIAGLARSTENVAERAKLLEQLEGTLHHMRSILDDILDYEKMAAVGLSLDERPFAPTNVIEDVTNLFRPVAEQNGISLRADIDRRIAATVIGDARRLRQVLYNLTHNALKFTASGHVTVSCSVEASDSDEATQSVRFSVRDTGPGMTPETIESLFSLYVSTDAPGQRAAFGESGTGLGLEISQRLVALMGGSLAVHSKVDEGSEFAFKVSFPVVRERKKLFETPTTKTAKATTPLPDLVGGTTALLAEDDLINLMVAEKLVTTAGFKPVLARDGQEAVELYQEYRPSLALLDNEMPRLNGAEAIGAIRANERDNGLPSATIIALTAYVDAAGAAALRDAGADEIVLKPLTIARLESVLRGRLTSTHASSL